MTTTGTSKGIHVVFQANGKGGLRVVDGDTHIMNLALVALLDCQSANPFQQLGISEGMIFENPDNELFNDLKDSVRDIFERFRISKLAKLQDRPDNLSITQTADGEWNMKVFIINLETNKPSGQAFSLGYGGIKLV